MKLNIPWIISRRRILFGISIDLFICIYLYLVGYFDKFRNYPNSIVTISLAIFWVISSYILGRYVVSREINFVQIISTFIKSISIFILCNFIYLFINSFNQIFIFILNNQYNIIEFQKIESLFFLRITILIALLSWVTQYIISLINFNINRNKKLWLYSGDTESFEAIRKEIKIKPLNIHLERIDFNKDINNLNYSILDGIILDLNDNNAKYDLEQIFFLKEKGISVISTLKWFELKSHRMPPNLIINKYQIIEKFNFSDNTYNLRIKRIGDLLVSLFLIILTLPISLLIALLIYLEDKGPIFYSQVRTGFKGERIRIYKFRSMIKNAEKFGAQWSSSEDKRITKVGKLIRATRLDELPQLFTVIQGEMSLIGPRPERPEIEEKLLNSIPFYNYRNILKPGISGWAQVNYPYGSSTNDTINKLSYDIYYINHISFLLDLLILFKTIKTVFRANLVKQVY